MQFLTCGILGLALQYLPSQLYLSNFWRLRYRIIWRDMFSWIAYTLQVVGQKKSPPAHAAIILSMETVFAVIGGFLNVREVMGLQEIAGCVLMLSGMLVSQLQSLRATA
jgi:drug/metabolite transporter (DMT)-like permease